MKSALAKDIDEYIAAFPAGVQDMLQQLRSTIKKAAPKAEEAIKYAMPTFVLNGNLIHFAAYKKHIGLYPAPRALEEFKNELSVYKGSKGAVQFPLDKPLPLALISRIVKYRVKENMEKTTSSKKPHNTYHKDGTIWAKGQMVDGEMDGYWEWFRKDGVIMRSGNFKKGKQLGEWTTYDKKGQAYKVTKMK